MSDSGDAVAAAGSGELDKQKPPVKPWSPPAPRV